MKNSMANVVRLVAILVAAPVIAVGVFGCKTCPKVGKEAGRRVMEAVHATSAINIDGKLDEAVWQNARDYPLQLSKDKASSAKTLLESGKIRLAWDEKFLYVGFEFVDSDVVAEGTADNLHHYNFGDVGEVFLKPVGFSWYWELYVTPAGRMSTFWFPGRGRLGLPSCFDAYRFDLKVAASCNGTLNKWEDKDTGWTAEMAVPVSELTARGEKFDPQAQWQILVARYNYSRYLPFTGPEYSMSPQLSQTNYHLLEEYAVLQLLK
ncbi:MAG: hypothetical protein A2178_04155 [Planctomycetes bacterium GWC2_49_10]|nr:MAG: hypothetical protein A2178_04155 [Planctomycetes bacterium GWC2_49_10]